MLSDNDLQRWYLQLGLPEPTRVIIDNIRSSQPARHVRSGRANVTGRYPSRKMGVTIQFESHQVELATIYELEHDPTVLEYWDQPSSIWLDYQSAGGRCLSVLHTPDFFVMRKTEAGWEECKTEEDLRSLAERKPHRYCADEHGGWGCPPGERFAKNLGLYYRVRSSRNINWLFQRNMQFLEDYLRSDGCGPAAAVQEAVRGLVTANPAIRLSDLFTTGREVACRDDIYSMIALGLLYVDLSAAALVEAENVHVFLQESDASVSRNALAAPEMERERSRLSFGIGTALNWDGKAWTIVNVGQKVISLLGEEQSLVDLPCAGFEVLVRKGRIAVVADPAASNIDSHAIRLITAANEEDLKIANQRYEAVCRYLNGALLPGENNSNRTLRFWVTQYRKAQAAFGSGYLGLLPHIRQRGNRQSKLPEATRTLMVESIDRDYESLKQKRMQACWASLKVACEEQGTPAPSYKTFSIAVHRRSGPCQTAKRQGRRAAYQQQPFYWQLEQRTTRHGDRPFEIVHIDHTELDLQLVCSNTGQPLGRPWLTLMIDAFSRRILALHLTYDPPSYRSCMMVLRACVRRHARLPQILVVDNGREFESTYFETVLARYECVKKTRPPAMPRFGSVCERIFGTANSQFVYNLCGNTQLTRQPRIVTKATDPRGQAVWPLADLFHHLCEYVYEVYDTTEHPALGMTPREAYITGLELTGQRFHRMVRYDQQFLILIMPTTKRGSSKVIPSRGVKIRYLYYWCDRFRDPRIEGQSVEVRYDPFDAGTAYAYVQNQWEECHSEYFSAFRGRSEKEIRLASQQVRRMREQHSQQRWLSARQLAVFLESVEAEEALLVQRWIDRENESVREAAGYRSAVTSPNAPSRISREEPSDKVASGLADRVQPATLYGSF